MVSYYSFWVPVSIIRAELLVFCLSLPEFKNNLKLILLSKVISVQLISYTLVQILILFFLEGEVDLLIFST